MRRRRADAQRHGEAILDAALQVLGSRPQASIEDVATAAGVSRQTVYAHFPSRDALVAAALERASADAMAAVDAAAPDEGSATDALLRLLSASWDAFRHHRLIFEAAGADRAADADARHVPMTERLDALVRRGQRAGEFAADLDPGWVVAAVIALGHAAGERAVREQVPLDVAEAQFTSSVLRLCGPDGP
ncbi:MAG TPA: TetR family transcriptional regulator [Acidimicrobiales bacterium]|nr:TetR family transcriptional regulator [Acidimicrobiales bacterium]